MAGLPGRDGGGSSEFSSVHLGELATSPWTGGVIARPMDSFKDEEDADGELSIDGTQVNQP